MLALRAARLYGRETLGPDRAALQKTTDHILPFMGKLNKLHQLTGWLVFAIAAIVYLAQRRAHGLFVGRRRVHPRCAQATGGCTRRGAPLFLIIGRMFAAVGDLLGWRKPSDGGLCRQPRFRFQYGVRRRFRRLVDHPYEHRRRTRSYGSRYAYRRFSRRYRRYKQSGVGQWAERGRSRQWASLRGWGTAFATSIWFSAVEGEVYAMSLFFTCLTAWAMIKWYCMPDVPSSDRWLLFALFSAGLSIGVHLLSILTIPAMAIFYYYKKNDNPTLFGLALSVVGGVAVIIFIQAFVIVGIPTIWHAFEIPMVNTLGLPIHSGIIPTLLILGAAMYFGLKYAHKNKRPGVQQLMVGFGLMVIAFSTVGVVVLRAEAKTPVNMNNPDNVTSLLPYLNREQYGERGLISAQTFTSRVTSTEVDNRYGLIDGEYVEDVNQKNYPHLR